MSEHGRAFADREVAALYRHRPPYPPEIFETLTRLLVEPRTVLDAGAGTGAIARALTAVAAHVDALDPSQAMIDEGRRLPGGEDRRLRWLRGRAEDAPLEPPYGLIVCGASLHWMDHALVLPRFRTLLARDARLAIVDSEYVHPSSVMRDEIVAAIRAYSSIEHHVGMREMVDGLVARGLFRLEAIEGGRIGFDQSLDDYLGFLGSTSTLNRAALGDRAPAFERDMRAVFARHGMQRVRYDVVGSVAWGTPA